MGLFSSTKAKAKLNPRAQESKVGGQWLMDFMKSWGTPGSSPQYPVQGVEGLTPMQQLIQNSLGDYLGSANANYDLATGQYKDTLSGAYDPRTSDYYRGFRQEAEDLRKGSTTAIRQRANMGGMLQSSPAEAVEAENNRMVNSTILKELGRMFEGERDRQERAAGSIQGADAQRLSTTAGVNALADLPRAIEQDRLNAAYEAAMQTLLHPYLYQSQIAQAMMNYSPGTWMKAGGPSEWTKAMSVAGDVTSLMGGYQNIKTSQAEANYYNAAASQY